MLSQVDINQLLVLAINSAFKAGTIQKEIYSKDFDIEYKSDKSPVTEADKLSNEIIKKTLSSTNFPFLSEEDIEIDYNIRKKWEYYWIIDPLDGTKEFIKKNGEFSVNIAFAKGNQIIFGVVYSPISEEVYFNLNSSQAFNSKVFKLLTIDDFPYFLNNATKITGLNNSDSITIAASRSHLNEKTQNFIDFIRANYHNKINIINRGSAFKICLVAEGTAQIYPRFGPTSEWDTAAGHAIVKAVGAKLLSLETMKELEYNKENILNPDFIAISSSVNFDIIKNYLIHSK